MPYTVRLSERQHLSAMDRYQSFGELAQHESEFSIEVADRESPVTVIAPHGGNIEPHSTDIARSIAADDFNLFCFNGLKPADNRDLHITSHRFDHPLALALVNKAAIVISVHGCTCRDCIVYLGGLDHHLIADIASQLGRRNISCEPAHPKFRGSAKDNICNRGRRGTGVQLEISRGLRDSAAAHEQIGGAVRAAVRQHLARMKKSS